MQLHVLEVHLTSEFCLLSNGESSII